MSWLGQCPSCSGWNTLVEEREKGSSGSAPAGKPGKPTPLRDVEHVRLKRLKTGIDELDRVLGGGIVPGSLILVGGSPGIGKSTLLNQALAGLAAAGRSTLYISGEESAAQVRLRAERIGNTALDVPVLAETRLEDVVETIRNERPSVCVVDSVHALSSGDLTSAPGSVAQVREVASALMQEAKRLGTAILLVGHVTKEGSLAGPRVLEHLVDCVLQFEGDHQRTFRTLRSLKNRFGSTNELGIFEMFTQGLVEVEDASARYVEHSTRAAGSCLYAAMEGSRPLLIEVQALVSETEIVSPRRIAQGFDRNRLSLVLAVLARHGGIGLGGSDVFVNLAGGVQSSEPGADLAVALAVASAAKSTPLSPPGRDGQESKTLIAYGELGLTGEVRFVSHPDRRIAEAERFGLGTAITPHGSGTSGNVPSVSKCTVIHVGSIQEALREALDPMREKSDSGVDDPTFASASA